MRRIVVIGASSGVGKGIALYYAAAGDKVGIAARREERLIEVTSMYPDNILYEVMDVTISVTPFVKLIERLGGIDLVIYCSGAGEQNTALDISKELNTVKVNIDGFLMVITKAFEYFSLNKEREIVPQIAVISSVSSIRGLGIAASYAASKRFQTSYMESLAQLAHSKGLEITFTSILPGFIDTDFIKGRKYPFTMELSHAVKCIINVINRRCSYKIVDWRWALIAFFWSLIPSCVWRRINL